MWRIIRIFLLLKIHFIYGKLTGDHICLTEETFLVNVTETYLRNSTVRNYQWCYNVPPRCSYYTTKQVNDSRIVQKNETRNAEACCPGFEEKNEECISICPDCKNGICENGKCNCSSGYKGRTCNIECSFGEWGPNCSNFCECANDRCDSRTGSCLEDKTTTTSTTKETTISHKPNTKEITTTIQTTATKETTINHIPTTKENTITSHTPTTSVPTKRTERIVEKATRPTALSNGIQERTDEKMIKSTTTTVGTIPTDYIIPVTGKRLRSKTPKWIEPEPTKSVLHSIPTSSTVRQVEEIIKNTSPSTVIRVTEGLTKNNVYDFTQNEVREDTDEDSTPIQVTLKINEEIFSNAPTQASTMGQERNQTDKHITATEIIIRVDEEMPNNINFHQNTENVYKDKRIVEHVTTAIQFNTIIPTEERGVDLNFNPILTKENDISTITPDFASNKSDANFVITPIATKEGLLIPVEIKYDEKQKPTTYSSTLQDKNHVSNEEYLNRQLTNNFSSNDFALFGVTILMALMLVVTILSINFLKKKKRKVKEVKNGKHQVSVFSASIFHSPLPEPPVTENPLYLHPMKGQNGIKEVSTFETRIVCNVNSPCLPVKDKREFEYDHPPSSFRSTSVVDSMESKKNQVEDYVVEPLYDEIPQKENDHNSAIANNTNFSAPMSIYINTCGRTQF